MPLAHPMVSAPRFGTQSRALIVDGHRTARNMLASQLRRLGIGQVQQCARAAEAVQQLQAREFDLVLCEYRLADGSLGQALIDDLRRRDLLSLATVVVMLSSEPTLDAVAEVAESALDGFIVKPYRPGDLEQRLWRATRRKQALRAVLDAVDDGRDADALPLCEQHLKARGAHWAMAARVGAELALRQERPALATAFFEAVLADKPLPWARLGLARALDAADKTAEALAAVNALVADEPKFADAWDVLCRFNAHLGDFDAAMAAGRQALAITPGSLLRAQSFAVVAHHAGAQGVALAALERAVELGADESGLAPEFDHEVLMLLALTRFQRGEAAALRQCLEQLEAVAGAASVPRLQRMLALMRALLAALQRDAPQAAAAFRPVAEALPAPGFDLEAALNLLAVLALLRSAGLRLDDAAWVRTIGLRFCTSRQTTDLLVRSCEAHPAHGEVLRAAHAEVGDAAERALGDGLTSGHGRAVEQLLDGVESTRNLKLWKLASATLARHEKSIEAHAALRERCAALRSACGPAVAGQWLAAPGGRPPGGLALGPDRSALPRRPRPDKPKLANPLNSPNPPNPPTG